MSLTAVIPAIERILLTLWVGGMWAAGLVFAPVLFASFERLLAGEIAGRLFSAVSLLGVVCGALLLAFAAARAGRRVWRDWRAAVLVLMLLITLVGELGLAAHMRALKEVAVHHPASAALWAEFGRLHGIASVLFVLNSVCGLLLVAAGLRPRVQAGS